MIVFVVLIIMIVRFGKGYRQSRRFTAGQIHGHDFAVGRVGRKQSGIDTFFFRGNLDIGVCEGGGDNQKYAYRKPCKDLYPHDVAPDLYSCEMVFRAKIFS